MAPGALGLHQVSPAVQYDDQGEIILTPAQQRVLDKQSEWEGFLKLHAQTEVQQQYMSELANKTHLMSDGTAVVGKVVSNWQNVFRATHLALASLGSQERRGVAPEEVQVSTLVRIPTAARKAQESEAKT